MTLETFTHIYFVGAGGIGMAALERYFLAKGKTVAGYDRTPTALTDALVAEGVEMTFSPESESIPAGFRDAGHTLVVYTPAVPDDLPILTYFRNGGFEVMSPSTLARFITSDRKSTRLNSSHIA